MSQPCRTPQYASSLLPGIDGTGTHASSVQPLTRSSFSEQVPTLMAPSSPAPEPFPRPRWWHTSPDPVDVSPSGRATSQANLMGPPSSKQQEVTPLYKALTASCLEAFNQDSHLVRETREGSFRRHSLNFSVKNTCDLSEVFWHMIMAAELLGSSVYEIKETWVGPDELQQANYALRALPKGLKFLRAVPPSESPKVMGLMAIHDLDALCHFYIVTHCPWCGKVCQNEGTDINHLWTVHYRLGLVCEKCHVYHPPCWRPSAAKGRRNANP